MNRFPHTVEVLRRSGTTTDVYGNEVAATTQTVTYDGLMQPLGGSEDLRDRNRTTSDWLLQLDPAAHGNIDASDQVRWSGVTYELTEPPMPWLAGLVHNRHVEVRLRVIRG